MAPGDEYHRKSRKADENEDDSNRKTSYEKKTDKAAPRSVPNNAHPREIIQRNQVSSVQSISYGRGDRMYKTVQGEHESKDSLDSRGIREPIRRTTGLSKANNDDGTRAPSRAEWSRNQRSDTVYPSQASQNQQSAQTPYSAAPDGMGSTASRPLRFLDSTAEAFVDIPLHEFKTFIRFIDRKPEVLTIDCVGVLQPEALLAYKNQDFSRGDRCTERLVLVRKFQKQPVALETFIKHIQALSQQADLYKQYKRDVAVLTEHFRKLAPNYRPPTAPMNISRTSDISSQPMAPPRAWGQLPVEEFGRLAISQNLHTQLNSSQDRTPAYSSSHPQNSSQNLQQPTGTSARRRPSVTTSNPRRSENEIMLPIGEFEDANYDQPGSSAAVPPAEHGYRQQSNLDQGQTPRAGSRRMSVNNDAELRKQAYKDRSRSSLATSNTSNNLTARHQAYDSERDYHRDIAIDDDGDDGHFNAGVPDRDQGSRGRFPDMEHVGDRTRQKLGQQGVGSGNARAWRPNEVYPPLNGGWEPLEDTREGEKPPAHRQHQLPITPYKTQRRDQPLGTVGGRRVTTAYQPTVAGWNAPNNNAEMSQESGRPHRPQHAPYSIESAHSIAQKQSSAYHSQAQHNQCRPQSVVYGTQAAGGNAPGLSQKYQLANAPQSPGDSGFSDQADNIHTAMPPRPPEQGIYSSAYSPELSKQPTRAGASLPNPEPGASTLRIISQPNEPMHVTKTGEIEIKQQHTVRDKAYRPYTVRRDASAFFTPGRVFKLKWKRPMGKDQHGKPASQGDQFVKPTFMLVVSSRDAYSICCQVSTYRNQGLTRSNLSQDDILAHAIIYSKGESPVRLPREPEMIKEPIPVVMAPGIESLKAASRVHFGKPHTIEWNVGVAQVGKVEESCIREIEDHFFRELCARYGSTIRNKRP